MFYCNILITNTRTLVTSVVRGSLLKMNKEGELNEAKQ